MKQEIVKWSASALMQAMQAGEVTAAEAAEAYISAIGTRDASIHAYLSVTEEYAIAQAKAQDAAGAYKGLSGVPAAIKDNICTSFAPTTCGSRMLEHFTPPYEAAVMERLMAAGAVPLGKTNMDEFAMGSSTENSAFGVTKNPRDTTRVPGGSSGGSAAAVAADEAAFALGSDTGGSIRQPAAFCGVVGMKPTYGRVSRRGLVAFASSLDQIGPITKTVEDSAVVLSHICGHDTMDSTSAPMDVPDFTQSLREGVKGLRLGLPEEFFGEGLEAGVKQAVLAAAKRLEGLGAALVPVSLPALSYALPAYYLLSSAEASSNLSRFDGVRYGYRASGCKTMEELYVRSRSEGFGAEVKRRILLGAYALRSGYYDAYYKKAMQVRTLVAEAFHKAFLACDVLLTPVTPTVAYRLGEKTSDPLSMYLGDIYTVPVNIAGLPAISVPCGESEGLPVGMQLIGRAFDEATLYRAAGAYEQDAGAYHMLKQEVR